MATLDISSFSLNDTTIIHLEHPVTGEYLYADEAETQPVTVEIYGKSSKQFRNYIAAENRKSLNPANKKKAKNADENLEDNADFYTALTKKISGLNLRGEELDNPDSIKKMYLDPSLSWVAEQVGAKLNETDAFLQK
jgi:hypothetical protein